MQDMYMFKLDYWSPTHRRSIAYGKFKLQLLKGNNFDGLNWVLIWFVYILALPSLSNVNLEIPENVK